MSSLLVRLYPARWRARYGEEFEAVLEERPLGPFDVADIVLGALDAQLRFRRLGSTATIGRSFTMSLRIGGFAAIIGGALLAIGIVLGIGIVGDVEAAIPGLLLIGGSAALVVALTGLSAFQARAHPVLSWVAVAVTLVGTFVCIVGIVGLQLAGEGYWYAFIVGIFGVFAGSTLFAIATYLTGALSRRAAVLLGAGSVLTVIAGFGGNVLPPVLIILTAIAFALGWLALGVHAVRIDQPAAAARPA